MSASEAVRLPEVIVFAGPNGSGKTTITKLAKTVGQYINADDIKRTTLCTDLEAAVKAEDLREKMIAEKKDFTFETFRSPPIAYSIAKILPPRVRFAAGF